MTLRDDVRGYFADEAERMPAPGGLRESVMSHALAAGGARQSRQWAVAVAAVLLSLAVVAGLLAAGNLRRPHTVPVSSPPRAQVSPAPSSLFHDHLDASAAGRPSLPPIGMGLASPVQKYTLRAKFPATPSGAAAYAVDPALAPSAGAVGRAFGVTFEPQADSDGGYSYLPSSLYYVPAYGTIQYSRPAQGAGDAEPRFFPHSITGQASAIAMAGDLLAARGIFTRAELATMQASAKRFFYPDSGNGPFWSIQFVRMLGGVPSGDGARLQVLEAGEIDSIYISRAPIGGSQPGSLIDAATAWQQVIHGHWYGICCLLNNGLPEFRAFTADQIELCYIDAGGPWRVPMWCFIDTSTLGVDYPVTMTYPALAPGTFDFTVPNRR